MEIDNNLVELRTAAENALATYERSKDAPYEIECRTESKVRATLESIASELRRFKAIHESWVADTRSLPPTQPRQMDAEIRTALRSMTEKKSRPRRAWVLERNYAGASVTIAGN
ncbi:MAG: hypothetical protein ACR2KU_11445 [Gammaproteobacteria bacterium]